MLETAYTLLSGRMRLMSFFSVVPTPTSMKVSKPSAATYIDTPFDLMITIVLNGLRAILENLDYVTDSEILKYAHDHVQEEGRDCDIMLRLIDIIKERESNYDQ